MYHIVRHPSYTGALISFLGFALCFHNFFPVLVVFFLNAGALIIRINFEEKILINHFGLEYLTYKKQTKRLIPWIY